MRFEDFLSGFVEIELQPREAEQVINEAIRNNLSLTNIYQKKGRLYVQVPLDQFWDFSRLLRKQREQMHIVRRAGLPFWISQLKRRKGLLLGGCFGIAVVYLLLGFVWSYEVEGNAHFSDEYIIALVQQYGVIPGAKTEDLDYDEIQQQFVMDHRNFTWISIHPEGTKIKIKVKERLLNEGVDERPACLIANQDGIVKELLVFRGTPMVQRETAVHAGQILIGGWEYPERTKNEMGIYEKSGEPYLVRAKGVVYGEVAHTAMGICHLQEERLEETGEMKKQIAIQFADYTFVLWGPRQAPYINSRNEITTKKPPSWKNYRIPVSFITTEFYEQKPVLQEYSRDDAMKIAVERGREKLRLSLSGAGQKNTFVGEELLLLPEVEEGQIQIQVTWTVEENLAEVKLIE